MLFSTEEKERRLGAAEAVMDRYGLSAVYLPGNSVTGPQAFGAQRYFTASRVVFNVRSVVMFKGGRLVAIASDLMNKLNLIQSSFIDDAVIDQDQLRGVIEALKANGADRGRVGTIFEILPASWLLRLKEELPDVEFVDVSAELFSVRKAKSAEETEAQRVCAGIADAGYRALCETVRPGMYENEIVAEIDKAMQRMGAEESFALITSGRFSVGSPAGPGGSFPALHNYSALNRKIEAGDVVAAEITPRYNGYWAQKVRTICVGEKNGDAERLRGVIVGSIDAAKPVLRAKTPICDVVRKMREYTESAGYEFVMPCGHLAGVDLNEGDVTEDNTMLLEAGMLVILHPTVVAAGMDTGIFWGESYMITEDGFDEIMQSGDALYITGIQN